MCVTKQCYPAGSTPISFLEAALDKSTRRLWGLGQHETIRACASAVLDNPSMHQRNLVPRVFSLSNMAAAGEKTLAHSRSHVTDLSTESGNLFKMVAKIKSERIWVRGLETGEKQTKWRQRQTQKKLKI